MTPYPHLTARNALVETDGGVRVHLSNLHASFAHWERVRWDRQSVKHEYDGFGTLPDGVEEFLRGLE